MLGVDVWGDPYGAKDVCEEVVLTADIRNLLLESGAIDLQESIDMLNDTFFAF